MIHLSKRDKGCLYIGKIIAALILLSLAQTAYATGEDLIDNDAWDDILEKYVYQRGHQTTFNYQALKGDAVSMREFRLYLNSIEAVEMKDFRKASKDAQLAFLINAYNAFTIKLVIDNYPVKSIRDIGGLLESPWKKRFFTLFGKNRSLDDLEHRMLRNWYQEPRIHYVIVCASRSCPPLLDRSYRAKTLGQQLDAAERNFLNDPRRNYYDASTNTAYVSQIFDWFSDDFEDSGSLKEYLAMHMKDGNGMSLEEEINSPLTNIKFLRYDWSLNSN